MSYLYVIGTPIGNLEDITLRALRILSEVGCVVAEDTRVTKRLLEHYKISKPLFSFHEHSTHAAWHKIRDILKRGESIAVVTDAGTPGISDPGGKLLELVRTELPEVAIVSVPGPSALTAALSLAGIPLNEFLYLGFLPHKKGRQTKLKLIAASEWPVVLFESVHRIQKLLAELASLNKQVVVCRELTKKFETVYRGSAQEIISQMPAGEIKGEFVVIIY